MLILPDPRTFPEILFSSSRLSLVGCDVAVGDVLMKLCPLFGLDVGENVNANVARVVGLVVGDAGEVVGLKLGLPDGSAFGCAEGNPISWADG